MNQEKSKLALAVERWMEYKGWGKTDAAAMCDINRETFNRLLNDPNYVISKPVRDKLTKGFEWEDFTDIWRSPFDVQEVYHYSLASLVSAVMNFHGLTVSQVAVHLRQTEQTILDILERPDWEPEQQLAKKLRFKCYRLLPGGYEVDQAVRVTQPSSRLTRPEGVSVDPMDSAEQADKLPNEQVSSLGVRPGGPSKHVGGEDWTESSRAVSVLAESGSNLARIIDDPNLHIHGIRLSPFKRELIKWAMGLRAFAPDPDEFLPLESIYPEKRTST
jgi:hypothetical protein